MLKKKKQNVILIIDKEKRVKIKKKQSHFNELGH